MRGLVFWLSVAFLAAIAIGCTIGAGRTHWHASTHHRRPAQQR
jgi:hypothetical protein